MSCMLLHAAEVCRSSSEGAVVLRPDNPHLFLRSDLPVLEERLRIDIRCPSSWLKFALLPGAFSAARE